MIYFICVFLPMIKTQDIVNYKEKPEQEEEFDSTVIIYYFSLNYFLLILQDDLSFGTLLPIFIKRLCFFETTQYRVDPEKAVELFFHPQVEAFIKQRQQPN